MTIIIFKMMIIILMLRSAVSTFLGLFSIAYPTVPVTTKVVIPVTVESYGQPQPVTIIQSKHLVCAWMHANLLSQYHNTESATTKRHHLCNTDPRTSPFLTARRTCTSTRGLCDWTIGIRVLVDYVRVCIDLVVVQNLVCPCSVGLAALV